MTDKEQIIIDGVDVRKCESYNSLRDYNCGGCRRCEERPDCDFKQLVCKTQECEKLRGDFHDTNEQLKDYKEHYDKQSEEHQKLKQDLFLAQNQITLKNEYIQKVKQECEELKAYAQRQENQREEYYKEYLKLSQECKELKKEIAFGNNGTLLDKIRAMVFTDLNKENNKLSKTLTEIKEIAEPFCNACQEFEPEKRGRNCMYCNYGKILQKISEVIK